MPVLTDLRLQALVDAAVIEAACARGTYGSFQRDDVVAALRELQAYRRVTAQWQGGVGLAIQRAVAEAQRAATAAPRDAPGDDPG
jgi:hypothetical protein